jgi:hypothetical protein
MEQEVEVKETLKININLNPCISCGKLVNASNLDNWVNTPTMAKGPICIDCQVMELNHPHKRKEYTK